MNQFNRNIDEKKLEDAKRRSIYKVSERINENKKPLFQWKSIYAFSIVIIMASVIGINLIDSPSQTPITINDYDTELLSTISYLSGSLLTDVESLSINNRLNLMAEETVIESELDEFNVYFTRLKPFLSDEEMLQDITLTQIEGEYPNQIVFGIEEDTYELRFDIIDGVIEGILLFNDIEYEIDGVYELDISDEKREEQIEFRAVNQFDSIEIKYSTENKSDETEIKFDIKTTIANTITSKEVKIETESDERKVVIVENNNEYILKQELGESSYKMTYIVGDVEGEVIITESTDDEGNIQYQFAIKENGNEKTLTKGRPDHSNRGNQGNKQFNQTNIYKIEVEL